jgi:zeaxanthin glucosyltransferase
MTGATRTIGTSIASPVGWEEIASRMRILLFPWPEVGHLTPMLALAAAAREMGATVVVAGLPDSEPAVRDAGFAFEPIFADLFPKGSLGAKRDTGRLAWVRSRVRRANLCLQHVADGGVRPLLKRTRPRLCLVDDLLFFLALPAYGERIPVAVAHTSFSPGQRDGLPPASSRLIPTNTRRFRYQLRWERSREWLGYAFRHYGLRHVGLAVPLATWVRRIAATHGYPIARLRVDTHPLDLLPTIPRIVLTPPELDFPGSLLQGRYYVGPFSARDPQADDFPWEDLDPKKRLVYCALGSRTRAYGRTAIRLFEAVANAGRLDPSLQVVIAAGHLFEQLRPSMPSHVTMVEFAPQQKVLERTDVFVTHGGMGSVRESVTSGVPMVVFPMVDDQPGNAARVQYHGLGVVGSRRDMSASGVHALLRAVLDDDKYRRAARQMQSVFLHRRAHGAGLDVLCRLAAGGDDSSASD